MKEKLPEKPKTSLFPRIFRFITESWKLILTSFVSGLILIAIVLQSLSLYRNMQEAQRLQLEREKTTKELNYWKVVSGKYKNYRDVYYKIASLEYKLGNISESKENVKKALELDPNFKDGKVLGEKVGL